MWLTYVVGGIVSLVAVTIIILVILVSFLKIGPRLTEMAATWKTLTGSPDFARETAEKIKVIEARAHTGQKNAQKTLELLQITEEISRLLKELCRNLDQYGHRSITSPQGQQLIKRTLAACRCRSEIDPDNDMEPLMGTLLRLAMENPNKENSP
ncbi:MAG: hypothetical protein AAB642_00735 [Patescibacteria group bacterium]|mgnify:CR=1 FL=1